MINKRKQKIEINKNPKLCGSKYKNKKRIYWPDTDILPQIGKHNTPVN